MKKVTFVLLALSLTCALPATAQFGKLLDKVKGKSSAGKKIGKFCNRLGIRI